MKSKKQLKNLKPVQNTKIDQPRSFSASANEKELSNELIDSKLAKFFYYGIRNNKIVKIEKGLEEVDNSQIENKIKSLSDELKHTKEYIESKVLDLFKSFRELAKTVANINDIDIIESERTLNATESSYKTILNTVNKVDDKMNHI